MRTASLSCIATLVLVIDTDCVLCKVQAIFFYEICTDVTLPTVLFLYNRQCPCFMDINLCIQTRLSLSSRAVSNNNHLLSVATSQHSMLPFVLVSSSELRCTNETQKYSMQVKCNVSKISNLHTYMHGAHLGILISNNVSNQNNKNSANSKLNSVHFLQV
jgi:hypothetical protein